MLESDIILNSGTAGWGRKEWDNSRLILLQALEEKQFNNVKPKYQVPRSRNFDVFPANDYSLEKIMNQLLYLNQRHHSESFMEKKKSETKTKPGGGS